MKAKRLSHVVFAVFAILLLGSMSAFAAAPVAPIQTPLSPTKIPQFAQPMDKLFAGIPVVLNADGSVKTTVDLSICEFQTNILPIGTPVVGALPGVAPATWVFGYQEGTVCNNGLLPRSYLGPAVVAARGFPTTMNFYNKLPDASKAKVPAYTTSVDQTVIWGDPLSLKSAATVAPFTKINGAVVPWNYLPPYPEDNECWKLQQTLVPPALLPAQCLNNYGFAALQPTVNTYAAPIPAAVHIHGGEVPSVLDGGPDAWWTANGIFGHGYYSKGGTGDATNPLSPGKATYVYPNAQEAAPVWFHDHMLGATRLNVYAGIAGAYPIIDPQWNVPGAEGELAPGLHPLGLLYPPVAPATTPGLELTIPLIVQDRMFDTNGQLYFPNIGINPEHPYWVPEFVGDTIAVNGKVWPYLVVQPKQYRFIFLNGSNARSYEMFFNNGPSLFVIGNDQGLLNTAQQVNPAAKAFSKLAMMPGERYEVVIDFSMFAGQNLILQNTAQVPWGGPGFGGAPVNGTTTGRILQFRVAAVPKGGVLPAQSLWVPAQGKAVRAKAMNRLSVAGGITVAPGVTVHKVRRLTLNEVLTKAGPLEILQNNTLYDGTPPLKTGIPARPYNDFTPIAGLTGWNTSYYTELPHEGETELWEIVNLTADAHPIHPHLVAFQILNRQSLDVKLYTAAYNLAFGQLNGLPLDGWGPPLDYNCGAGAPGRGVLNTCVLGGNPAPDNIYGWRINPPGTLPVSALIGLALPPAPQEIGWKDTAQVYAGTVTRMLVRFAPPTDDICARQTPGNVTTPCVGDNANSIGYPFSPNHGHGYVWHCHIVDHEDNEMMRPFTVADNPGVVHTYVQGTNY